MLQTSGTKKPRNALLVWSEATTSAFHKTKDALVVTTMLAHTKRDAELCLKTDASDVAVGAVFQQKIDNVWQPLDFF